MHVRPLAIFLNGLLSINTHASFTEVCMHSFCCSFLTHRNCFKRFRIQCVVVEIIVHHRSSYTVCNSAGTASSLYMSSWDRSGRSSRLLPGHQMQSSSPMSAPRVQGLWFKSADLFEPRASEGGTRANIMYVSSFVAYVDQHGLNWPGWAGAPTSEVTRVDCIDRAGPGPQLEN